MTSVTITCFETIRFTVHVANQLIFARTDEESAPVVELAKTFYVHGRFLELQAASQETKLETKHQ